LLLLLFQYNVYQAGDVGGIHLAVTAETAGRTSVRAADIENCEKDLKPSIYILVIIP
jgi:hypothetical protein